MKLGLIGAGAMGSALLTGWMATGMNPTDIAVAESSSGKRAELEAAFEGIHVMPSPAWAASEVDVLVICVKPDDVLLALEEAVQSLDPAALIISVAAGFRISRIEEITGTRPVIRAMPNAAALVRKGVTGIAPGSHASEVDLKKAANLLAGVGLVEVFADEVKLDAVTGLTGSGPAYLFLVAEALIDGGVRVGIDRSTSEVMVCQLFMGAAEMLSSSGKSPTELRAMVTSPGGTTVAAIDVLENRAVRAAMIEAVAAATERSKELGSL